MAVELDKFDFDPEYLKKKYREERDKRLRQDGNEQYIEIKGEFSYFEDDPYVEHEIVREPIHKSIEVAIIGGGFGGMLAGCRLKQEGIEDILIFEKGSGFGGTWYWNRYPGASCDIESYIYLPMLEETGFTPKFKYTNAPETLEYCEVLSKKFALYESSCLQTEVLSCDWNENKKNWIIKTNKDDVINAKFVVHTNGPLSKPKLPAIKGINNYKGHTFHTSRWDYSYTGGDSNGKLDRMKDKRVAIIGTGATAVQCIPHLGNSSKELLVFQRTPSPVDVRNNTETDPDWISKQKEGWQQERVNNFEKLLSGGMVKEDMVKDGWTEMVRMFVNSVKTKAPSKSQIFRWSLKGFLKKEFYTKGPKAYLYAKAAESIDFAHEMQMANYQKMEQIRSRAQNIVKDAQTAESLKPYYNQMCKRPCFHDEYLETFNLPNVKLIDTDGKGVEEITEKGIIFNGKEYEVDCIIFATGFEVGTGFSRQAGYEINGDQDITLTEKFKEGASTFHGMHIKGFPNSFFFGPIQSGYTATYTYALDQQSIHLAYILKELKKRDLNFIEATDEAEKLWIEEIIKSSRVMADFQENCTPGYYNNEGKINNIPQNNRYGGGAVAFYELLKDWREEGSFEGLKIS